LEQRTLSLAETTPHWWTRWLLGLGMLAVATTLLACGGSDNNEADAVLLDDASQTGQQLTNEYISLLQKKDVAGLTGFLSDAFMIQRADGSNATKADYLTNLPQIGQFTITNVIARQAGNSLVVRWDLTVNETIDGKVYAGTPAPRLSTFIFENDEWRLMSHANFNAPATAPAAPVQPAQ
jgi:hypothetical protein